MKNSKEIAIKVILCWQLVEIFTLDIDKVIVCNKIVADVEMTMINSFYGFH